MDIKDLIANAQQQTSELQHKPNRLERRRMSSNARRNTEFHDAKRERKAKKARAKRKQMKRHNRKFGG